ncbi:MAG: gamma-glutamylcyclotransferase [Acidiferrobacterales bacterium]|nr:gamma-glutamylcyclotransferase [Acidiferrobacterales bacterium]
MNAVFRDLSVSADQSIYERLHLPRNNLWVFGYGSLMWNPGFFYTESRRGKLFGYHRSLCLRSVRYRGTDSNPGLVFGLDRGGSCTGMCYRLEDDRQREIAAYLQDRELLNNAYNPFIRPVNLDDGRCVDAIVFVVKRQHPSYVRNLTPDQMAGIVARAAGHRGPNLDYVMSTIKVLEEFGIRDRLLCNIGRLASAQSAKLSEI